MIESGEVKTKNSPVDAALNEYFFKAQDDREAVTIKAKSLNEAMEIYNQK